MTRSDDPAPGQKALIHLVCTARKELGPTFVLFYSDDYATMAGTITVCKRYLLSAIVNVNENYIPSFSSQLLIERNARESAYANVIEQCLFPISHFVFTLEINSIRSPFGSTNNTSQGAKPIIIESRRFRTFEPQQFNRTRWRRRVSCIFSL